MRPGTQEEWLAAHEAAIGERRWFVFPTWAPQYLNRSGRLRPLRDTQRVLGGTNHASLAAPVARWRNLPASTRLAVSRISPGLDAVNQMDWLVNVDRLAPREAAKAWIRANESRFLAWIAA